MTVADLRTTLEDLPDDWVVVGNGLGNLVLFDGDGEMTGWIETRSDGSVTLLDAPEEGQP